MTLAEDMENETTEPKLNPTWNCQGPAHNLAEKGPKTAKRRNLEQWNLELVLWTLGSPQEVGYLFFRLHLIGSWNNN